MDANLSTDFQAYPYRQNIIRLYLELRGSLIFETTAE